MIRLLLSLLAAGAVARADFDPAHWKFRRSIAIAAPARVVYFVADRTLYQGSRAELADIRIVRDHTETPYLIRRLDDRDEWPVSPSIAQEGNTTVLNGDIGFPGSPHDQLDLKINTREFYRSVEVESSADSQKWRTVARGFLTRAEDLAAETVAFPEQWDRYVRVRIFNHDDPPLEIRQLVLSAERRVVEFPAEVAGQYWLYYGSAGARQPSYDFEQTRPAGRASQLVSLGGEEMNPAYRAAEKPWTDRHPGALYGVLAAAILIMGFIAVRLLLKLRA